MHTGVAPYVPSDNIKFSGSSGWSNVTFTENTADWGRAILCMWLRLIFQQNGTSYNAQ